MLTKTLKSRKLLATVIGSLLVFAGVIGWLIYENRYVPGKITFQQYEPTYWLQDSDTVKHRSIKAYYIPSQEPSRYTAFEIEMSDGSVLSERKAQKNTAVSCPTGTIAYETCLNARTPKGQPYVLYTSTDSSGKVVSQSVVWLLGSTHIHIRFNNIPKAGYASQDIGRVIQSFKLAQHKDLPVRTVDRSSI